jgi:aldehyde dehydrogenase (NAD+)
MHQSSCPVPDAGYWCRPTLFTGVSQSSRVVQEEIFGPVLAILPYDSEDEAVELANASMYGLAGGVWAGTPERAMSVARRMRTGQVDINGGRFNPLAPFGGYKKSGIGREIGPLALEEFFQLKSIQRG